MDKFEFNKIAGAVLFGVLVLVVINHLGDILVHPTALAKDAYPIKVETASVTKAAPAKAEPQVPLAVLLAKADPKKGAMVVKKCEVCHNITKGGANRIGPDLWGIVDRPRGKHPGFNYSHAMATKGGNWTYHDLFVYLKDPQAFVPGNKMAFAGLPRAEDRANLIVFLRTLSDHPVPLPPVPKEAAAPAKEAAPVKAEPAKAAPAKPEPAKK